MRVATITRATAETEIRVSLDLDGSGQSHIRSGIGFFDHMLTLFAKHGGFDLVVECNGDIEVDGHHSVEDIGIVLGQVFAKCTADKTVWRVTVRGSCRWTKRSSWRQSISAADRISYTMRPLMHR